MHLTIGHLYPDHMSIYGDRGNVIALTRRAQWAGMDVELRAIGPGEEGDLAPLDLLFMGGGQDKEQALIAEDLVRHKAASLRAAAADGLPILAICGGYQLLGHYFRTGERGTLPGIGVFDAWTIAGNRRCIGDCLVESDLAGEMHTIVGFENHSGQTYLGEGARPLGRVLVGYGNNIRDRQEGAVQGNAVGAYLHGALLPKNPWLADWLIRQALLRRYGRADLPALDDTVEEEAHRAVIARVRRRGRIRSGAI